MIVGEEKPDEGAIRIGETVTISYVDQSRERIDPKKNVWEVISDGEAHIRVGNVEIPSRAVITSHDRWFLDRVATHILAWEGGANWFWYEGNFESYEKNKIERLGAEAARPHRVTYRRLTRS